MKNAIHHLPRVSRLLAPSLLAATVALLGSLPITAQAGCNFDCAFRTVTKPIKGAGDKGIKFASDQGRQLASMTQDEFKFVKNGTNQVVYESRQGLETGYNQAISTVGGFMDDQLIRMLRSQANSFMNQNEKSINKVVTTADKLSDQARAALKRIAKAVPSKVVDPAVKADMQLIATEMGFTELFGSVVNSSWGIGIGGDLGVGPVGANSGVAIVMDVRPDRYGNVNGAIVTSVGASVGLDLGAGAAVSIFWQPGLAKESTGLGIGWGLSLESRYGGGGLGLSFPISIDPKDYASVMALVRNRTASMAPGISVSVDIPGAVITEYKASYDVNVGWSQVVANFVVSPAEICKFVTSSINGVSGTKVAPGSSCPGAASDSR